MRIGVLGGSFNPAHEGHRHIAQLALRRLRLDQVWLLVSPGNPLKPHNGMAPQAERLASAQGIVEGRRIVATAIESALGTRFTAHTLRKLRQRFPRVRFVWLMGADNLVQLPRWNGWMCIARGTAFAVLPRPSYNHRALAGQAAQRLRPARRASHLAPALAGMASPAWVFLPAPQHAASATAIRAASGVSDHRPQAPGPAVAAGPARSRTPAAKREQAEQDRLDTLQALIVGSLEDDKAENVVALDLAGRAAFADRMVIATGLADRQIAAMATHLEEKLREAGLKRIQIEGAGGADWVLIDAGDIVIHLFKPEARALYALEKMWGAELDEEPVASV